MLGFPYLILVHRRVLVHAFSCCNSLGAFMLFLCGGHGANLRYPFYKIRAHNRLRLVSRDYKRSKPGKKRTHTHIYIYNQTKINMANVNVLV